MISLAWQKPRRGMKNANSQIRRYAIFGECSRYRVDEFIARDGATRFMVLDCERPDDLDLPGIVRDEPTLFDALRGLPMAE